MVGHPIRSSGYLACKSYLYLVQTTSNKYQQFMELMRYFENKVISLTRLREEVTTLFQEFPHLDVEFQRLVPVYTTGYAYRKYVEGILRCDQILPKDFSQLLKEYKAGRMDVRGSRETLNFLFSNQLELVDGLQFFVTVEAIAFLNVLNEHFTTNSDKLKVIRYREFNRLEAEVQLQRNSGIEFIELFQNDRDFIQEFLTLFGMGTWLGSSGF
ncbi:hypothetical protein R1flu_003538 [Riccia fluitans]|uniref:Uncharacterized protein n=1 Tax=Riccia fluitans TaxID=41844 RepID=A0ABD1Y9B2_9MARC